MSRLLILAQSGSLWVPPEGSTGAAKVDSVLSFVFWISAFFFLLIVGLMLIFVIRYRQRKAGEMGEGANSHLGIELVWTGIPILVVAAIFWAGFTTFVGMVTPPEKTYDITVIAQQWQWLFQYPNGWVDGELHVPVDTPIKLTLRSEDVIHSFYVPAFRKKMDVVPGRLNQLWFEADKVGEYPIYCAEYCGTGHSNMISKVIVHPPGGYEKWLRNASSLLSPAFKPADVLNAASLLQRIKGVNGKPRPVDVWVNGQMNDAAKKGLASWAGSTNVPDDLLKAVLDSLNQIMKAKTPIYTKERFEGVNVSKDLLAEMKKKGLAGEDLLFLNRYLLAEAYPDALREKLDLKSAGKQIYETKGGCKQCHSTDGTVMTGPSFKGIFGEDVELSNGSKVKVDENYIRESIEDPRAKVVKGFQPVMPTFKGKLKPREIDALIEFIKSLGDKDKNGEGK